MKIKELYTEILSMVCDVTGISHEEILKSNREECADARYLLVRALSRFLTDNEIGTLIKRTRQGVSFIRSNLNKINKWTVASNWKAISKLLESNYFTSK